MLRRYLRTIFRASEEIFDHPIRNAKILAGTALACLVMERIHQHYDDWRERNTEVTSDEHAVTQLNTLEVEYE
jgi:hypothetical protein